MLDRIRERIPGAQGAGRPAGRAAEGIRTVAFMAAPLGAVTALIATIVLWSLARHASAATAAAVAVVVGVLIVAGALPVVWRSQRAEADDDRLRADREQLELSERVRALESARRESDVVLGSVRAHLMLLDSSYFIQSRYSNELEDVFHQNESGSENLLTVLQRLLSDRMFRTSRDYLALLFDDTKREKTVLKVNPLEEIEVNVTGPSGAPGLRYLKFSFRRILENGRISRVLVSVEDITERTVLERQLRESEVQKVRQFELLIGILHVEPRALDGFVHMATDQLAAVDRALNASDFNAASVGQSGLLLQRLDVVLQRVHNIKGNASLLRLDHFEKIAQDFEQKVIELKYRGALGGDDFLTLVIALAEFRADLDRLQTLRVKLAGIQRNVEIREEVGDDLVTGIRDLAAATAAKLGKDVRVDADGFDTRGLPPAQRLIVKDTLIQLVRNSLVHGVEPPAEREAARKSPVATIDIHPAPEEEPGTFAFTYRDDGRGLDAERIKRRAIELGMLDPRDAATDDPHVASLIFTPGFSTESEASLEAGRGMGMNVIKQRIVDDCSGEITVNSQVGQFCEFTFVVPTHALARAAVAR